MIIKYMDLSALVNTLCNTLNPDKLIREASEAKLLQSKAESPSKLLTGLIAILIESYNENIKSLSVILLRQYFPQLWRIIDLQTKELLKTSLIQAISMMKTWSLLKKLTGLVSEVAIIISQSENFEK